VTKGATVQTSINFIRILFKTKLVRKGMTLSGVELCERAWIFAALARAGKCEKQKSQRLKAS
jgi:hypothetical protein